MTFKINVGYRLRSTQPTQLSISKRGAAAHANTGFEIQVAPCYDAIMLAFLSLWRPIC